MLSIQLDEARFKECSRRLSQALKSRGIEINHQSVLQVLSAALSGKPYEEIKATLLEPDEAAPANTNSNVVMILNYGSQSVLSVNFDYINATNPGTDLEIPYRVLEAEAWRYANTFNVQVQIIDLPAVLTDDYPDDDIIELAIKMGYGKPHRDIFTCLNEMSGVKINGKFFDNTGLDSDNMDSLPDEDDPWSVCVWMPELRTVEGTYEYFFTFDELCKATTKDGHTWAVPYPHDMESFCEVTFLYAL